MVFSRPSKQGSVAHSSVTEKITLRKNYRIFSVGGRCTEMSTDETGGSFASDVVAREQSLEGLDAIPVASKVDKGGILRVGMTHSLDNFVESPGINQGPACGIGAKVEPCCHCNVECCVKRRTFDIACPFI